MGRIKKKLKNGDILVFIDESGFSLIPVIVLTWGLVGKTPSIKHLYNWEKLSCISAITTTNKLYFRLHRGKSIKKEEVIEFLRRLLRHIKGKIIIFWDGLPQHRSKKVKDFFKKHPRLEVHRLPPYSPDMNPDEWVWNYLKIRELGNFCAKDTTHLMNEVHKGLRRMQRRPELICSFMKVAKLPWEGFDDLLNHAEAL